MSDDLKERLQDLAALQTVLQQRIDEVRSAALGIGTTGRRAADRIEALEAEKARLMRAAAQAHEAVSEALSLCQHTAEEWMAMSPELRDFKLKIFGTLELRCLNLSFSVVTAPSRQGCAS